MHTRIHGCHTEELLGSRVGSKCKNNYYYLNLDTCGIMFSLQAKQTLVKSSKARFFGYSEAVGDAGSGTLNKTKIFTLMFIMEQSYFEDRTLIAKESGPSDLAYLPGGGCLHREKKDGRL